MNLTAGTRSKRGLPQPSPQLTSDGTGLDIALLYASLDFRVFPCHSIRAGKCSCGKANCSSAGKHPRTRRGVKDATTDEATIRKWWSQWPDANIAIAGGNGLAILDIDPARGGSESLAALEAELGALPTTWRVSTGGGGEHRYVEVPAGVRIGNHIDWRPGIDIRSDNGYVIAPPSNHKSGGIYEWASQLQLPGPRPVSAAWLDALPKRPARTGVDRTPPANSAPNGGGRWSADAHKRVNAASQRLQVRQPGTRNKRMMALVQAWSKIPELRGRPASEFIPSLFAWFDLSKDNMQMEWVEVAALFVYQWGWVNRDYQDEVFQAHAAAMAKPPPDAAKRYSDGIMQTLAALCCELERRSGAKNWFLTCRKAQDVLGIPYKRAQGGLKQLVDDGVIEKVAPHKPGSMKGQRFRYIGEQAGADVEACARALPMPQPAAQLSRAAA